MTIGPTAKVVARPADVQQGIPEDYLMPLSIGEIVAAGISGGLGSKLLDWLYSELLRRSSEKRSARKLVDTHLDPILKAADELIGKIRSLAQQDFSEIKKIGDNSVDLELLATLHYFCHFWARLKVLRDESIYIVLSSVEEGKQLQEFMYALEATRVRLITRARQRAIGDLLIVDRSQGRTTSLADFCRLYQEGPNLAEWLRPFEEILRSANQKNYRQSVLLYGAVVHALIDTLDRKHRVTRQRTGWGNKLSDKSRRELRYRVFGVYLPFVKNPHLYIDPPVKNEAPAGDAARTRRSPIGRLLELLRLRRS